MVPGVTGNFLLGHPVCLIVCVAISGLRTYFPLIIIVASSWVTFWLVSTPAGGEIVARVGLGITCCLGNI